MTASFMQFFAVYWKVNSDQKFQVLGFSRTGYSAYLDIAGRMKMVPVAVLNIN